MGADALETVLGRLEAEYENSQRANLFRRLRDYLSSDAPSQSQEAIATELGKSEGAVKQAVHRLRRRYRELLREEISHTVATAGDVEDEFARPDRALARLTPRSQDGLEAQTMCV